MERVTDARHESRDEKRVSPKLEKAVVHAHLEPKDLAPHVGKHFLQRRPRRRVSPAHAGCERVAKAKRLPVDLPVWRQRQRVQHHDGRWHHVSRQPVAHVFTQQRLQPFDAFASAQPFER